MKLSACAARVFVESGSVVAGHEALVFGTANVQCPAELFRAS